MPETQREASAFGPLAWSVRLTYAGFAAMAAMAAAISLVPVLALTLPGEPLDVSAQIASCITALVGVPLALFFGWLTVRLWRTGRYLVELRRHRYCVVTNRWLLVIFPLGTLVGGCVLWLLTRRRTKRLFGADATPLDSGSATVEPA